MLEQHATDEGELRACSSAFLVKLRSVKERLSLGRHFGRISLQDRLLDVPESLARECIGRFVARVQTELQSYLEGCVDKTGIESPPVLLVGGASRLHGLREAVEQLAPGRAWRWNESDYASVLGAVESCAERPNRTGARFARDRAIAYREAVESVAADAIVSLREVNHLVDRQNALAIPEDEARTIETAVLGQPKEAFRARGADVILVRCSGCGHRMFAHLRAAGQRAICRACGIALAIPGAPPAQRPAPRAPARPAQSRVVYVDRPTAAPTTKPPPSAAFVVSLVVLILLLVLGFVALAKYIDEGGMARLNAWLGGATPGHEFQPKKR